MMLVPIIITPNCLFIFLAELFIFIGDLDLLIGLAPMQPSNKFYGPPPLAQQLILGSLALPGYGQRGGYHLRVWGESKEFIGIG